MTTFLDGPAEGCTLMLRRAPLFLRVVEVPDVPDSFDGLDAFDDSPKDTEIVHIYRRQGEPTRIHLNTGGKKGGGWFTGGQYVLHTANAPDAITRSLLNWRQWCLDQVKGGA
jgi:hypothetical protein